MLPNLKEASLRKSLRSIIENKWRLKTKMLASLVGLPILNKSRCNKKQIVLILTEVIIIIHIYIALFFEVAQSAALDIHMI